MLFGNRIAKGLMKLPRHRQFDYKPLYYNPDKEERQKRREFLSMERGHTSIAESNSEERMRYAFKQKRNPRKMGKSRSKDAISYGLRLAIIIIGLLIVAYKYLNTEAIQTIFGR
jgi:hypothetical protein